LLAARLTMPEILPVTKVGWLTMNIKTIT
jgi:hypothetical protein